MAECARCKRRAIEYLRNKNVQRQANQQRKESRETKINVWSRLGGRQDHLKQPEENWDSEYEEEEPSKKSKSVVVAPEKSTVRTGKSLSKTIKRDEVAPKAEI